MTRWKKSCTRPAGLVSACGLLALFLSAAGCSQLKRSNAPCGGSKAPVVASATGFIPPIKQPSDMSCWAAVTTMMVSWQEKRFLTIEQTMNRLGYPWKGYFQSDAGLASAELVPFLALVGLKGEPPANYTLPAYRDFLRQHGPLWITTGDGFNSHARVLVGLYGDGTYGGTCFEFIDPMSAKTKREPAVDFLRSFEAEARYLVGIKSDADFRMQILHW